MLYQVENEFGLAIFPLGLKSVGGYPAAALQCKVAVDVASIPSGCRSQEMATGSPPAVVAASMMWRPAE